MYTVLKLFQQEVEEEVLQVEAEEEEEAPNLQMDNLLKKRRRMKYAINGERGVLAVGVQSANSCILTHYNRLLLQL